MQPKNWIHVSVKICESKYKWARQNSMLVLMTMLLYTAKGILLIV